MHSRSSQWISCNPCRPSTLPIGAGVYVVLIDGKPVYVGQSQRLRARFYEHQFRHGFGKEIITPWGDFSNAQSIVVKCKESRRMGDWAMWEIRLIHRLKPMFNKTHLKLQRVSK